MKKLPLGGLGAFDYLCPMQSILVLVTFLLAAGFLIKKFVWNPIFEARQNSTGTLDGEKTKCGRKDCGCH